MSALADGALGLASLGAAFSLVEGRFTTLVEA
jgi:hypothetical protein